MTSLNPADQADFRQAASALLTARERAELAREQATPLDKRVNDAFRKALIVVERICRPGGPAAIRFRGRLFFPVRQGDGTMILHIVGDNHVADVPG
jgi:hypothetical protein